MTTEFSSFDLATEKLMHKANQFASQYVSDFDDISECKPGAYQRTQGRCNELREAIRKELTQAYLDGCAAGASLCRS